MKLLIIHVIIKFHVMLAKNYTNAV